MFFHADEYWTSNILMSKKFSLKYISLKGYICKIDIRINIKQGASEADGLTVMLIHNYYKSLTNITLHSSSRCPIWGCFRIVFINKFKIKKQYYFINQGYFSGNVYRTWLEVDKLCKKLNSSLPSFETKDKMDEFLALLKTSEAIRDIPAAIPIGLRYNYSMVGIYLT